MNTLNVLLIEDNEADVTLAITHLRDASANGYMYIDAIDVARTLAEAEDKLSKGNRYHLVVTDMHIPDSLSPDDILQVVRAYLNDVPIVVLTGYDTDEVSEAAAKAQVDAVLLKGETNGNLRRAIELAVRRRKVAEERENSLRDYIKAKFSHKPQQLQYVVDQA